MQELLQGRRLEFRVRLWLALALVHAGQYAPHVSEAFRHSGQRIILVGLVLEHDAPAIVQFAELPEDRRDRPAARAYGNLRVRVVEVPHILDMNVEEAWTGFRDGRDDIHTGLCGMAHVQA